MSTLRFEQTARPGFFVARFGEKSARVVAHVVNGRAVIGFDEETPAPEIEAAIQSRNDFELARRLESAS